MGIFGSNLPKIGVIWVPAVGFIKIQWQILFGCDPNDLPCSEMVFFFRSKNCQEMLANFFDLMKAYPKKRLQGVTSY